MKAGLCLVVGNHSECGKSCIAFESIHPLDFVGIWKKTGDRVVGVYMGESWWRTDLEHELNPAIGGTHCYIMEENLMPLDGDGDGIKEFDVEGTIENEVLV